MLIALAQQERRFGLVEGRAGFEEMSNKDLLDGWRSPPPPSWTGQIAGGDHHHLVRLVRYHHLVRTPPPSSPETATDDSRLKILICCRTSPLPILVQTPLMVS